MKHTDTEYPDARVAAMRAGASDRSETHVMLMAWMVILVRWLRLADWTPVHVSAPGAPAPLPCARSVCLAPLAPPYARPPDRGR